MQNQTPDAEPQDRDVYEGQTVHSDRNRVDHVVVDDVKQNSDRSRTGWSRSLSHQNNPAAVAIAVRIATAHASNSHIGRLSIVIRTRSDWPGLAKAADRGTMAEPSASSTRARSVDELAPSTGCRARSRSEAHVRERQSA